MEFPRQEYWSGLPFPSLGDLPDTGIKPTSPALAGRFFTGEPPGKPIWSLRYLGRIRLNKMRNKDSGGKVWGWTKAWTTNKLVAQVNPTKGHFLWRSLSIRYTAIHIRMSISLFTNAVFAQWIHAQSGHGSTDRGYIRAQQNGPPLMKADMPRIISMCSRGQLLRP